jgi:hypothetical protein
MTAELTDEQRKALNAPDGNGPLRLVDTTTNTTYVLVPAAMYDRFLAQLDSEPVTEQERLHQLREFGRRAGWDDPEMDVYDHLDPSASRRLPFPGGVAVEHFGQ